MYLALKGIIHAQAHLSPEVGWNSQLEFKVALINACG